MKTELPSHCVAIEDSGHGVWPRKSGRWFCSRYIVTGDYISACQRSNYRVFEKMFAAGEGTWWRYERGTIAIRTLAYRLSSEVRDILDGLEEYPIIDEGDMSDLEREDEEDHWETWGRDEFRDELRRVWDANLTLVNLPADETDDLFDYWVAQRPLTERFWEACNVLELYPEHGSGEVSFPTVDAARECGREFEQEGFFAALLRRRAIGRAEESDMGPKPLPCGGSNGEHWHEDCRQCLELSLACAASQGWLDFAQAQTSLLDSWDYQR